MIRSAVALGTVLVALAAASSARAEVVWLCKPGERPNPCVGSNRTTVQTRGQADRIEDPATPSEPPIDCFYVYPTASNQPTLNANKDKSLELDAVARQQAQRFSLDCKVYAPVYRQRTVLGISTATPQQQAPALKLAYGDVVEAWREYLRRDNAGRGFVLLGHSQGSRMLRMLIRNEIDPDPVLRARLVSALIPGANVLVRKGRPAGGDFQNVPACTSGAQTGCVAAWQTFADAPPDDTRFGRVPTVDPSGSGLPVGPDYEVLCKNPASLAANERVSLSSLYRPELFPGVVGPFSLRLFNFVPPLATTPWVVPADRYSGRCATSNGANVLMLSSIDGAQKLSSSPDDTWGLHLIDVNVVLNDLIDLVARQTAAYLAAPSPDRVRLVLRYTRGRDARGRSCSRSGVGIRLRGVRAASIRSMSVRVGGRRVAVDRRAPFSVRVDRARLRRGASNRIDVRVARRDAGAVRLTATIRGC